MLGERLRNDIGVELEPITDLPSAVWDEDKCRARAYGLLCNGRVSRRETRALAVLWICAWLAEILGWGVADV